MVSGSKKELKVKMNEYSPEQRRGTAIRVLAGPCSYDEGDGAIIKWRSPEGGQPSEADIEAKVAEYAAEWDAQEYARNRQAEYPDMGAQFNKIYDDGLTKWKTEMVDPVKTKWPKDNSGPVE